jgi:DNA-binding MarR family transcriptional regulator
VVPATPPGEYARLFSGCPGFCRGRAAELAHASMKRLSRKGLLILVHDPKDSRKKLVSITRKGKSALDEASGKILRWNSKMEPLADEIHKVRECLLSQMEREI